MFQPIRLIPYIQLIVQFRTVLAAVVALWVRALAPQVEGWVFESQPRQT